MSFRRLTKNNSTDQVKISLAVMFPHIFYSFSMWISTKKRKFGEQSWWKRCTGYSSIKDSMKPKHLLRCALFFRFQKQRDTAMVYKTDWGTEVNSVYCWANHLWENNIHLKFVFGSFSVYSFHCSNLPPFGHPLLRC